MAAWTAEEKAAFRAMHPVKMPEQQPNHNYPHADTKGYLNFIFAMDRHEYKGLVPVATRKADGTMKTVAVVPAEQIGEWVSKMHISTKLDYYIGRAQQSSPDSKWGKDAAFAFNMICCDIDCHSDDDDMVASPKHIADLVCNMLPDHGIPAPNAVVYTGRGLHLVWAVAQVAGTMGWMVTAVSVAYTEAVEGILRDHNITGYAVDHGYARNISGLTRLPGSYNTKAGIYASVEIIHRERVELLRAYDSIPIERTVTWKVKRSDNHVRAAGRARVQALLRLVEQRGTIDVGGRDNYLLALYCSCRMAGMTDSMAAEYVLRTNHSFLTPMPSEEVLAYLTTARRKGGYKFCSDTIIDLLGITSEEQSLIGLSVGAKSPNAARDRRTAAKRRARNRQIMELYLRGWTVYEIADTGVACANTARAVIRAHQSQSALMMLFSTAEIAMIIAGGGETTPGHQNLMTHIIMLIGDQLGGSLTDPICMGGYGFIEWEGWRRRWNN